LDQDEPHGSRGMDHLRLPRMFAKRHKPEFGQPRSRNTMMSQRIGILLNCRVSLPWKEHTSSNSGISEVDCTSVNVATALVGTPVTSVAPSLQIDATLRLPISTE
jgi:hypothetical protein